MKKYFINYSNHTFKRKQQFSLLMAKLFGGFDSVIGYSSDDIDINFYKKNKYVLGQPKGAGYWLWKPYFVCKTLKKINFGDYLFYCDSGAFPIRSVDSLIIELEKSNQDIMGYELPLIEYQWTKRELLINLDSESDKFINSNQIHASFFLIKKTQFSVGFFNTFLKNATNIDNITDTKNDKIIPYADFIAHRHDQSIFSILYKKNMLKPFKDPSQFGQYPEGYASYFGFNASAGELLQLPNGRKFRYYIYGEKYRTVLHHSRKRNPLKSYMKFRFKEFLYKLNLYKGRIV